MWGAKEERDEGGFQEVEVNCQKAFRGRCRIVRQEGGAENTEREIENLPWTHQELRTRRHALERSGGPSWREEPWATKERAKRYAASSQSK